jgi:precorrin-2/cobalt-factor-2 C20-methyltransferase
VKRLTGVGVGPGDVELITVQAVRLLREADVVLVPVMGADVTGRAEATVRAYVDAASVRRVVFALDDRDGVTPRRAAAWDGAAEAVAAAFGGGAAHVAFATIGDPNVYSTFTYLAHGVRARVPGVVVDTVAGITAMQDLAARSGTVLCEGRESLILLPLTAGLDAFAAALADADTVVAYKGGARLPEMLEVLRSAGRLSGAVYGAALGLPEQDVRPAAEVTGAAPYLSTVIVPARRSSRGGKI